MIDPILPYIEHIITAVLALCVFLAARNNIWNWPVGLVGVTMYGSAAYFMWGLYADAYLQIFYFLTGVGGWIWWLKGGHRRTQAKVSDWSLQAKSITFILIAVFTIWLGMFLEATTDSVVPYMDSFTTVTCLVAQVLLMMRNRFTWVLWIIADVVYVYMFYVKGLNLLSIEYFLFTLNAVYGYWMWTKAMKEGK